MRREQEQFNFWFPYLEQLESVCSVHDLNNLLSLHPRTLAGFTREEMLQEAIYTIKEADKQNYIRIVDDSGKNMNFEYTEKFKKYKNKKARKLRCAIIKKKSEYWVALFAGIMAFLTLIAQLFGWHL